jgi:RNA polymerase sigma factor (sigma-70 family)
MVSFMQQFDMLTVYGHGVAQRKNIAGCVDVEVACADAMRQWMDKEGEQETLRLMSERKLSDPPPLLRRIVKCRLLDQMGSAVRRPLSFVDSEALDRFQSHRHQQVDVEKQNQPSENIHRGNTRNSAMLQAINACLQRLSPEAREIIHLRLVCEMPSREVGEKFGLSENAVNLRVSRFVERVREFSNDLLQ